MTSTRTPRRDSSRPPSPRSCASVCSAARRPQRLWLMHSGDGPFHLRPARRDDVATIESLITRSVQQLGAPWYAPDQIASALRFMFGVDTQLIDDGTYF